MSGHSKFSELVKDKPPVPLHTRIAAALEARESEWVTPFNDLIDIDKAAEIAAETALKFLDDDPHHVVRVTNDGWTLKHPLSCRAETGLFDCPINKALEQFPDLVPGIWNVSFHTIGETHTGLDFLSRGID